MSAGHSRESRYASDSAPPNASQIKLSDGLNPFDAGALAPGATVQKLDYDVLAVDAGFKYRGFSFQSEFYVRKLSDFLATGPVPPDAIVDRGFQVQGMHMVVPRLVGVYLTYGKLFDDFDRKPWELSGGASYYPSRSRSWRLNFHVIRIEKSPAASNFGFYTSGQSGTTCTTTRAPSTSNESWFQHARGVRKARIVLRLGQALGRTRHMSAVGLIADRPPAAQRGAGQ